MADAVTVRVAAGRFVDAMTPGDRIGIFSTSGQLTQDFTSDKEALKQKLLGLMPRGAMGGHITDCPTFLTTWRIRLKTSTTPRLSWLSFKRRLQCMFGGNQQMAGAAQAAAQAAVMVALNAGDADNNYTYRLLEEVLRRLAGKPGERVLLLASPGFLITTDTLDESGIVDRANRANIVINALDARGLYVPEPGGTSRSETRTPR